MVGRGMWVGNWIDFCTFFKQQINMCDGELVEKSVMRSHEKLIMEGTGDNYGWLYCNL